MGDGLELGLQMARTPVSDTNGKARRLPARIVLLSDGKSERGTEPVEIADRAKKLKIPIYTIALGTQAGRPRTATARTVPVPPDTVTLRDVAETTGGRYFSAPSAARLETIYENLGDALLDQEGQAGDHVVVRRRRARAAAGGQPCSRCCGWGGCREPPHPASRPSARPTSPAPGPIPPQVLRSLTSAVLRRVESLVPGEHLTPQVGGGTELAVIRPYRPGDDVRHIDWNVTARMREPHVRVHVGERAMTAWLLLDVSASMTFGTADRRKADVAEGVALAVGHVSTRRGNRLGVVALRGGDRGSCARARAGSGCWRCCTSCAPSLRRTARRHLARRCRTANRRVARSRGLVVVVSDFRGEPDWEVPLKTLRARHGVLAVEIRDPREMELPPVGDLWVTDPETGRQLHVNTNKRRVRKKFAEAAAEEREEVAAALRRVGADHLDPLDRG